MKKLLNTIGNINIGNPVSENDLKNSNLFDENLVSTTDDKFFGIYKNVPFKITELMLSNDGGKAIFKGVILLFNCNKKINNKTVILTKNNINFKIPNIPYFLHMIFGFIFSTLALFCFMAAMINSSNFITDGIFLTFFGITCLIFVYFCYTDYREKSKANSKIIKKEKLDKINTEDTDFNKNYIAYSSDQVEGRYLITTAFMERFKNLQSVFGTKRIKCSFYDDKIMFAIATRKNVFEIGNIFKSLTNPKNVETLFNEIISIYLLIDYFKLNEKIGL